MKASTLAIKLVRLMAEHGDIEVICIRGDSFTEYSEDAICSVGVHEKSNERIIILDNSE